MTQSKPRHVAIIMDGNGRWAGRRGWPRTLGHRAGADAVRRAVEAAPGLGIEVLTLYAFSSDNWSRPAAEVKALFGLLERYLEREAPALAEQGVRLEVVGRRSITLIDGADSETDAWEVKAHRPMMISNVRLHSLPNGYRFDLERRERVEAPMLHAVDIEAIASS